MTIESLASVSVTWLWSHYGQNFVERAAGELQIHWSKFHWHEAEAKYRTQIREQHSTTRVLGNPRLITIEDTYTDVYVLDKPTAFRRFDLEALQSRPWDRESLRIEEARSPIFPLVRKHKRLFILGKPGAGKTTFLKFLALQACDGKISKTPIFVSLKEWADSRLDMMSFFIHQFDVCGFPDAKAFIEHLLKNGDALVLFDGLDEVNQQGGQRAQMISVLTDFAKKYPSTQICLTCRIAATDYSFAQFTYLEIADFDERQLRLFAGKWYQEDRPKLRMFLAEIDRPEHQGLREMARTPLLLALLCLAFDETLSFPPRRVDLYNEAIDALFKKWDSSRGILRDEIYHKLSIGRKEQLLARLAAQNFEAGAYFMRRGTLANQINEYLRQLPTVDIRDAVPDGDAVLQAIEAQHGIIVERAHEIYSFSHLTFQEYFVARYVVDNAADGTVIRLVKSHLMDERWREVILLTASILDNADAFFYACLDVLMEFARGDKKLSELLRWLKRKGKGYKHSEEVARAFFFLIAVTSGMVDAIHASRDAILSKQMIYGSEEVFKLTRRMSLAFDYARDLLFDLEPTFTSVQSFSLKSTLAFERFMNPRAFRDVRYVKGKADSLARAARHTLNYANDLARYLKFEIQPSDSKMKLNFMESNVANLVRYLSANRLLLECLRLSVVSDRNNMKERFLLPPWS